MIMTPSQPRIMTPPTLMLSPSTSPSSLSLSSSSLSSSSSSSSSSSDLSPLGRTVSIPSYKAHAPANITLIIDDDHANVSAPAVTIRPRLTHSAMNSSVQAQRLRRHSRSFEVRSVGRYNVLQPAMPHSANNPHNPRPNVHYSAEVVRKLPTAPTQRHMRIAPLSTANADGNSGGDGGSLDNTPQLLRATLDSPNSVS